MFKHIILLLIYIKSFFVFGQVNFFHIVDNDVVSEEGFFYSAVVDKQNKLWIATELGVFKCDHQNLWKKITDERLADDVFDLYPDNEGNIWLSSYVPFLQYISPQNKLITIDSIGGYAQRFVESKTNGIFFQNYVNGIGFFDDKKIIFTQKLSEYKDFISLIDFSDSSYLIRKVEGDIYEIDTSLNLINKEQYLSKIIPTGIRYEGLPLAKLYLKEKIGYNKLLELSKLPVNAIHLSKDRKYVIVFNNTVEVYNFDKGYDKQKSNLFSEMNFNSQNFASFFEDSEENLWITNLKEGVFRIPYYYKNFNSYKEIYVKEELRKVDKVIFNEEYIFLIDTTQKLFFKKSFGIRIKKIQKKGFNCTIIDKEGVSNFLYNIKTNESILVQDKDFISDVIPYKKDYFFLLKKKSLAIANINNRYNKIKFNYDITHPTSVLLINDSILFVGTVIGLFKININNNKQKKIDLSFGHITQMSMKNNKILIGTLNNGLFEFNINFSKGKRVLKDFYKIYSFVVSESNGKILINTEKGIFLTNALNYNEALNLTNELKYLNKKHIFFLDNKNLLSVYKNKVVGYHTEHQYPNINLKIKELKVNNKEYKEFKKDLSYYQNNITFNVETLTLSYFNNVNYYYKFLGHDTGFIYSENPTITYKNLPPNKYNFEAFVTSKDGNVKSNMVNITVIINPPFWDLWWFKILVVIFVLLIIYIIHRLRLRIRLKKEILQKEIYESKLNNIKAQVNPHFFSNALVGVQQLFIEGRELEANEYIAKLGRLSRKIISSSNELVWPLLNEMTLLKDYCDIEKERFKSKIHIIIDAEENIDREKILIPTMLIQPLIENSIKHGINENEELIIQINFKIHQDKLIVNVEDNGVGINTKQNNKLKEGTGLKMFKKKIDLVNEQYNINIIYKVITKPIIKGTNFIIELPINYE